MPDLYLGAGQGLAVGAVDGAVHDERVAGRVAAVVQAREALRHGRARHVERPLDGARRAIGHAQRGVLGIHAHVEVPVEAQPGRQQPRLAARTELVQVGDAGPVFVGRDVQVLDGLVQIRQDAVDDLLGARVAAFLVQAAGQAQEVLDFLGVEDVGAHRGLLFVLGSWKVLENGIRRRARR
jgi:hypothetical protein